MSQLTKLYSLKIRQCQSGIEYAIFKNGERHSAINLVYNSETQDSIRKNLPDILSILAKDKATKLIFDSIFI